MSGRVRPSVRKAREITAAEGRRRADIRRCVEALGQAWGEQELSDAIGGFSPECVAESIWQRARADQLEVASAYELAEDYLGRLKLLMKLRAAGVAEGLVDAAVPALHDPEGAT
ncbi:hypothetical protein [Bosea sp. UC22_33]|uniref:hypothetical protein n=1 Tax=Bosea sp. UC22_33 TaxID=3350165 RepID=UPI0036731BCC